MTKRRSYRAPPCALSTSAGPCAGLGTGTGQTGALTGQHGHGGRTVCLAHGCGGRTVCPGAHGRAGRATRLAGRVRRRVTGTTMGTTGDGWHGDGPRASKRLGEQAFTTHRQRVWPSKLPARSFAMARDAVQRATHNGGWAVPASTVVASGWEGSLGARWREWISGRQLNNGGGGPEQRRWSNE
ncbi:hypothetical protein NL676_009343 [Syzygium grande]|nr:hypothetical protein NL676_009343 [Syzygium grande]